MMGTHRAASVSEMADQFNHTEKDVVRSLRYWERKGLLALDFGGGDTLLSIRLCRPGTVPEFRSDNSTLRSDAGRVLSFSMPAENPSADSGKENPFLRMAAGGTYPARTPSGSSECSTPSGTSGFSECSGASGSAAFSAASGFSGASGTSDFSGASTPADSSAVSVPSGVPVSEDSSGPTGPSGSSVPEISSGPSELEALESFRTKPDRAQLLFVIEQYIGKPLSLNEIRIIHNISEGLGFSDNLIDYLLQYCVDRGKKDFRYIRKVAENWAAAGIMTPGQAERAAQEKDNAGKRKARGTKTAVPDDAMQFVTDPAASVSGKKQPGGVSGRTRSANSFNQFEQNNYDFDALEEELLQS